MKNGRLYDGNTLDELYPRKRPLAAQPWVGGGAKEAPIQTGIR